MKTIICNFFIGLLLTGTMVMGQESDRFITRQGQVSFFSYTAVEDIKATNNQVLSIIDTSKGEIAVKILMRAFLFEKALMEEHFNESYVESDLYPELNFVGTVQGYKGKDFKEGTHLILGEMDFHGVKKNIELKANAHREKMSLIIEGELEVAVNDFNIKIPALLSPNIAKNIKVEFRFEYFPYE